MKIMPLSFLKWHAMALMASLPSTCPRQVFPNILFHVVLTMALEVYYLPLQTMAPHSSTLAWKIPWTEEPGRLQSMGSLRVGHDWATSLSLSLTDKETEAQVTYDETKLSNSRSLRKRIWADFEFLTLSFWQIKNTR